MVLRGVWIVDVGIYASTALCELVRALVTILYNRVYDMLASMLAPSCNACFPVELNECVKEPLLTNKNWTFM